jgi:hypothetical protein
VTVWESINKVDVADEPARRARDIEEGIGYACALLMDEYGRSGDDVQNLLERYIGDAQDNEEQLRVTD